jgi:hypothetical protein
MLVNMKDSRRGHRFNSTGAVLTVRGEEQEVDNNEPEVMRESQIIQRLEGKRRHRFNEEGCVLTGREAYQAERGGMSARSSSRSTYRQSGTYSQRASARGSSRTTRRLGKEEIDLVKQKEDIERKIAEVTRMLSQTQPGPQT